MFSQDFFNRLKKITTPWASNAASSYVTEPVPETTASPAASWQQGFPPATASPTGTPPNINDFNGILKNLSGWAQWYQAGGPVYANPTFQLAVGGYPSGAIVQSRSKFAQFYLSFKDYNLTDPDTGTDGWTPFPVKPAPWSQMTTSNGATTGFATTVPNGITQAIITIIGAGGGGGGFDGVYNSGGGGGGAIVIKYLSGLTSGWIISSTIGVGGKGGRGDGSAGAAGKSGTAGGLTSVAYWQPGTPNILTLGPWNAGGGGGGSGGPLGTPLNGFSFGGLGGVPGPAAANLGDINLGGSCGEDGPYNNVNMPAGSGAPGWMGMGAGKGSLVLNGTQAAATANGAGGGGVYGTPAAPITQPPTGGNGFDGGVFIEWFP